MTIGSVTYDGIRYDSVLMQYDEIADILVVRNPEGKFGCGIKSNEFSSLQFRICFA
jgi:hypothetical protein